MHGKGAVILAGLDMAGVSVEDYSRLYWGPGDPPRDGRAAELSPRPDRPRPEGGAQPHRPRLPDGRGSVALAHRLPRDPEPGLLPQVRRGRDERGGLGPGDPHVILAEAPQHLKALYEGFFHEMAGTGDVSAEKVPVFCDVGGRGQLLLPRPVPDGGGQADGRELPADLVEAQTLLLLRGPAARGARRLHAGAGRDAVLAQLRRPALAHRLPRTRPGRMPEEPFHAGRQVIVGDHQHGCGVGALFESGVQIAILQLRHPGLQIDVDARQFASEVFE
ncbi:MAG: hypothetical protein WDM92_05280 [Caulobacteraceae bacterium]